eukprot:6275467-Alexandrium_andersonii.AAC.1
MPDALRRTVVPVCELVHSGADVGAVAAIPRRSAVGVRLHVHILDLQDDVQLAVVDDVGVIDHFLGK